MFVPLSFADGVEGWEIGPFKYSLTLQYQKNFFESQDNLNFKKLEGFDIIIIIIYFLFSVHESNFF